MTLDQYYYPVLDDTSDRDKDQVLTKFLGRNSNDSDSGHADDAAAHKGDAAETRILMVDQLWMWIIDESMSADHRIQLTCHD